MSHTCRALLMHCIDFRFGKDIKQHMEEHGLLGDADIAAFAGAAKNLVDPAYRDFALRQIELSKKLHGIREVHLMNHADCGAYGGRAAFADREAERRTHAEDLAVAASLIKERHPDLDVICWIAHLEEDGHDRRISFERVSA